MLNELEEFRAYTDPPVYASTGKRDNTYLGRFTFDMLMQFEGLRRVLTILARGFMFDGGSPNFQRAREALLAWCSVPDKRKKSGEWQFRTAFPELHEVFPALVDEDGTGWFCRHVHNLCHYAQEHPDSVSKKALVNCQTLSSGFDGAWRDKVVHMQVPLFTPTTLSAWGLRFDDVLADAAELGPLRNRDFELPRETVRKLKERLPADLPFETAETLIKYYAVHHTEDSDWVVLPVVNFDAYPDSEEVRASGLTWISAQYGNGVDVGADGWQYAETSIAKISKTVDILGVSLHVSGLGAGGKCYGDNLVIYEYDKQGELIRTIVCEDKDTAGNFSFWSDDGSGSGTVSTSVGYDDKRALLIEGVVGSANMTCVNILPVTGHTYKAAAQIKVENAEDGASVAPTIEMYAADSITGIDRVMLENAIVKNLEASAKADVPLFCGEFGAGIHCFEEDRGGEIWVSDMIDLLTLYGVGFSYHNYRSNSFGIHYKPDGVSAERRNELLAETFAEKLGGVYVPVEAPDDEKEVPEPAAEAVPEAPEPEVIPEETEAEEPKQAADAQSAVSSSEGTASVQLGKKGCGSMLGGGWIVTVCLSLAALACGRRKEE